MTYIRLIGLAILFGLMTNFMVEKCELLSALLIDCWKGKVPNRIEQNGNEWWFLFLKLIPVYINQKS